MIGALVLLACASGAPAALAQEEPAPAVAEAPAAVWRVVTKDSPPFAFRDKDGEWTGVSIDLAEHVAGELGVELQLSEKASVEDMLVALESGEADAALAAITVTPEREARVDFSHPYYVTGLGVAVRSAGGGLAFGSLLHAVTSRAFLELIGLVGLILVTSGVLFWVVERKHHPQFEGGAREGVGTGIWWSTIILFGHKGIFPKTGLGCLLAATGMLMSILLLSVLTGAIASVLTVSQLETPIQDIADLRRVRTVTVPNTSSAEFLDENRVLFQPVATLPEGLEAIDGEEADALVYDAPLIEFLVSRSHPQLRVLEKTFEVQDYAAAFPLDSRWRKPVNRVLLDLRSSEEWRHIVFRYLGR